MFWAGLLCYSSEGSFISFIRIGAYSVNTASAEVFPGKYRVNRRNHSKYKQKIPFLSTKRANEEQTPEERAEKETETEVTESLTRD